MHTAGGFGSISGAAKYVAPRSHRFVPSHIASCATVALHSSPLHVLPGVHIHSWPHFSMAGAVPGATQLPSRQHDPAAHSPQPTMPPHSLPAHAFFGSNT